MSYLATQMDNCQVKYENQNSKLEFEQRWIGFTSVPLAIGSIARTKATRFSNTKTELGTQLEFQILSWQI